MYATATTRSLVGGVAVVLVVVLAAAAGTAVGTVLRDQLRTEPGAPISREDDRTATAAFSLEAIEELHALRAAEGTPAAADPHARPSGGQRKAATSSTPAAGDAGSPSTEAYPHPR